MRGPYKMKFSAVGLRPRSKSLLIDKVGLRAEQMEQLFHQYSVNMSFLCSTLIL